MNENDCSVLINSCDSYSDIWEPFFYCFNDNWTDCPYPVFLNTESETYNSDSDRVYTLNFKKQQGASKWGERLLNCLKRIESDYIILLFDDFCLEKKVDQRAIEKCLQNMKKDDRIDAYYLINIFPELHNGKEERFIEVPIGKNYRLNSAPGIWRKSSLIKYTGKNDTPWAWEYFGTMRTEKAKDSIIYVLNGMPDIFPYNYTIGGAIHRGKWVKTVIEPIVNRYNIRIDLGKRGFTNELEDKNSRIWLFKFYITGIRMVGLKALRGIHFRTIPKRLFETIMGLFK